jgi:hypothetical protein
MNESSPLSTAAMCRILGTSIVPLSSPDMAKSLRVAFYPVVSNSDNLDNFLEKLRLCLIASGVSIITYQQALEEGRDGRIGKGIVLIATGEGETGNLAIDHVASLTDNTVVAVLGGKHPGLGTGALQNRVDALVSALAWNMAHVIIYVDDTTWTVCNMNGAIDTYSHEALKERVLDSLIPKLATPVVPPQKDDFKVEDPPFDISVPGYEFQVRDMLAGSEMWGKTGLLASQTKIAELEFRTGKYRRIASAFLSYRTGMSYGFLARQLPLAATPAVDLDEAPRLMRLLNWAQRDFYEIEGHMCVALNLMNKRYLIKIPHVSVICTRSGCEKTRLNPERDLLKLSLVDGKIVVGIPKDSGGKNDFQPSFDTLTILAHALGNAIVASALASLKPSSTFHTILRRNGLALAHWHGFVHSSELPEAYYLHGLANPPVSCSTPQAAIFALSGKLGAVQQSLEADVDYLGDVHVEPSHGTNITGDSLVELAGLVERARMRQANSCEVTRS